MKVSKLVEILLRLPQEATIQQYEFEYGMHEISLMKPSDQEYGWTKEAQTVDYLIVQTSGDSTAINLDKLLQEATQNESN